jgi:Flp pilus assembly protein TadB
MNRTAPVALGVVAVFCSVVLAIYGQVLVGTSAGVLAGFVVIIVVVALGYVLMSEHARSRQKVGEQVRF